MNAQRIDERPQERESQVRHAHAVQASRHGRASAPGYLGLPADEVPEDARASAPDESEQKPDESPRRSAGRARAREAGANDRPPETPRTSRRRASKETTGRASKETSGRRTASKETSDGRRAGKQTSGRRRAGKQTSGRTGKQISNSRKGSRGGSGTHGQTSERATGRPAQAAATSVKRKVASTGEGAERAVRKGARKEAAGVGGALLKRALLARSRQAIAALARAASRSLDGLLENAQRLPIQKSIDVAVPPEIAWQQWMELRHLPEGTHRLSQVQREGEQLTARIAGPRRTDWSAEVIDEREQESFAWRSTEGADSAGLATFHPLGDRLTRIELTVDVRPEDLGEATRLLLRIADRRVEEELRRFKADVELLNPDIYEELLADDGMDDGGDADAGADDADAGNDVDADNDDEDAGDGGGDGEDRSADEELAQ
jgi:uncharacterized membrane protein